MKPIILSKWRQICTQTLHIRGNKTTFCTVTLCQVYYDVIALPIAWPYHRQRRHGVLLWTTETTLKLCLLWKLKGVGKIITHHFAEGKRESHSRVNDLQHALLSLVMEWKSWTRGLESLVPSAMWWYILLIQIKLCVVSWACKSDTTYTDYAQCRNDRVKLDFHWFERFPLTIWDGFGIPAGSASPFRHVIPYPFGTMLQYLRPVFPTLMCLFSTFHLEYPSVLISRFCLTITFKLRRKRRSNPVIWQTCPYHQKMSRDNKETQPKTSITQWLPTIPYIRIADVGQYYEL